MFAHVNLGLVTLTDCNEQTGGFCCIPGVVLRELILTNKSK